jgi:hypothetical protein
MRNSVTLPIFDQRSGARLGKVVWFTDEDGTEKFVALKGQKENHAKFVGTWSNMADAMTAIEGKTR